MNAAPQVEYDPRLISYRQLLDVFWSSHDSRQVLGQGPDVGNQYRWQQLFALAVFPFNRIRICGLLLCVDLIFMDGLLVLSGQLSSQMELKSPG